MNHPVFRRIQAHMKLESELERIKIFFELKRLSLITSRIRMSLKREGKIIPKTRRTQTVQKLRLSSNNRAFPLQRKKISLPQ